MLFTAHTHTLWRTEVRDHHVTSQLTCDFSRQVARIVRMFMCCALRADAFESPLIDVLWGKDTLAVVISFVEEEDLISFLSAYHFVLSIKEIICRQ